MAITVPSQTVQTMNLTGNNTAFSVNVPSDVSGGILSGDYIIVLATNSESEDNDWSPVPPSGMDGTWITELQVGQAPPSIPGVHVFYELCSGGESGTRTMTGDFPASISGICFVVRGVDTTTPLDVAVQTVQSTATGDPDPPAITPTNNDCLILAIGLQDDTDANALISYPTNYTGLTYLQCTESTGHNIGVAYRILSGGGGSSENPSTFDLTNADEWAGATIALRPGSAVTYKLEGITKDNAGSALGSCHTFLCKDNGDNTATYKDYQLSNASTGAYSFTGITDDDASYFVISWKDDSPHVFDCTDHVLQPVEE